MEFPSTFNFILTIILSFPFLLLLSNIFKKNKNLKKLPPGPWKLPLIGNLHQLAGKLPHRVLADLAKKYGPLMHLQLGEIPVIVVSSPKIAKEIMKTHELVFAGRPEIQSIKVLFYDLQDIAFHPYDEYWRQMRKICVMELLSAKKVRSFGPIRRLEGDRLVGSIRNFSGKLLNLSEQICLYTSSVVWRAAFGMKCNDQETFIQLIKEASNVTSGFGIADIFPSYKFIHLFTGMKPKLMKIHSKIDDFVEEVIKQHVLNYSKRNGEIVEEDIIDTLIRIKDSTNLNIPITTKNIKAVILDLFTAGNETTSTTIIWAMTEMIKNPQVMKKAQNEIRQAFERNESINEVDLQGLEYLNQIIKEILRLHPPSPLNLPKESTEDSVIDGYYIPNKTKVIVNAWAIGRDPEYWRDPDTFIPERFQNNNVDFFGNHMEFIPFGSGRRMCPGITFALVNIQLSLALLLYHFDWSLPKGIKTEDMDMKETLGATCPPIKDLYLIPTFNTIIAHV